jgi:hypothetical protein
MRIHAPLLLLLGAIASCLADKVLVLVEGEGIKASHSQFLKFLTSKHEVNIKTVGDSNLKLKDWDKWLYDSLVILAPKARSECPPLFSAPFHSHMLRFQSVSMYSYILCMW